jgi:hypothetical protein
MHQTLPASHRKPGTHCRNPCKLAELPLSRTSAKPGIKLTLVHFLDACLQTQMMARQDEALVHIEKSVQNTKVRVSQVQEDVGKRENWKEGQAHARGFTHASACAHRDHLEQSHSSQPSDTSPVLPAGCCLEPLPLAPGGHSPCLSLSGTEFDPPVPVACTTFPVRRSLYPVIWHSWGSVH